MPTSLPALIFDLDGTLTDSKPGILGCLQSVIDARGIRYRGSLDRFIGPPVEEWTAELMPAADEAARMELANAYRACYNREGWMGNAVYPGVHAMLAELREQSLPLYVCTSKRLPFAVRILDRFELSPFFAGVYGDQPEFASHSKVDLLASLLRETALDPRHAWMIGDRSFDFNAARANGVPSMAAAWGYGSTEEWVLADAVAATPADVLRIVQSETR